MKKLKNSDFCSIQEVMSMLNFKQEIEEFAEEELIRFWVNTVGTQISKFSKPIKYENGTLTIACKNSQIANELYLERHNLLQIMCEKDNNLGTNIKELKIAIDK